MSKKMISLYTPKINIKPLDASIQLLASHFNCGNIAINSFIKSPNALDEGFGKTFVWLEDDNLTMIGFYNIGLGCIDGMNDTFRYKMGGAVHINELALDENYQKVKIGSENVYMSDILLGDCIERVLAFRRNCVGFSFITLQSTEEGYQLYKRHDFFELEEDMDMTKNVEQEKKCVPMYLALDIE